MSRITDALDRARRETAAGCAPAPSAATPLDSHHVNGSVDALDAFRPEEHSRIASPAPPTEPSNPLREPEVARADAVYAVAARTTVTHDAPPVVPGGSTRPAPAGHVAWYSEGFSDLLGDRLRLFDNTGPGLELLRFHAGIAALPGFESAVRAQLEALRGFRHPCFARARSVSWLEESSQQIALVSDVAAGERLSRVLRTARLSGLRPDPDAVIWLLRAVLDPLAALHAHAPGVAHGALGPDRIVIGPHGEIVLTEYVLAPALSAQRFSPGESWARLRMATTSRAGRAAVAFDARGDVEQVARLAIGLLAGRPAYGESEPDLAEELASAGRTWGAALPAPLASWLLEAATDPGFAAAGVALEALQQAVPDHQGRWSPRLLPSAPAEPAASALPPTLAATLVPSAQPAAVLEPRRESPARAPADVTLVGASRPEAVALPAMTPGDAESPSRRAVLPIALTIVALAFAAYFAVLLVRGKPQPTDATAGAGFAGPAAPSQGPVDTGAETGARPPMDAGESHGAPVPGSATRPTDQVTPLASQAVPAAPIASMPAATPVVVRPVVERSVIGWVEVSAGVDVRVYANGRLLGTGLQGRYRLPAGQHDVLIVNEDARVRATHTVRIVPGETVPLDLR